MLKLLYLLYPPSSFSIQLDYLEHLLAVLSWINYLTYLSLSFFLCRMVANSRSCLSRLL